MTNRLGLLSLLLFAAACSSTPTSAPTPAPASPTPPPPAAPPRPGAPSAPLTEPPDAWQLLDMDQDLVPGASVTRAYRELLADRVPGRTVVVAIIDSGVDTAHVDLRGRLWLNRDETPGNGIDDDGNGYVDDVRGWNFLGGPDGRNVEHETYEFTRLHSACRGGSIPPDGITCGDVEQAFNVRRFEVAQTLTQIDQIQAALAVILPLLRTELGGAEVTAEAVQDIESADPSVAQARTLYLQLAQAGLTPDEIEEARDAYQDLLEYGLNTDFDPRGIVGDDPADGAERVYGNSDVTGPDASHGTHVAGIVGAGRGNGIGIDGIATSVELMILRAVPNGDERDKDIANAIRYAVDNGADIINMSFGKAFSPGKALVDASVRYADERGVLLIHAAGNDGQDIDAQPSYPTREYRDGNDASNWITVAAANWVADSLAAPFSNYGRESVDVFAPGVAILSTVPGSEVDRNDGTSMAAPVVTGVAALLMAYFPDLDAADVRRLLLESAVPYGDRTVARPGSGEPVPFGALSVTGAVVNAFEAVRLALEVP